MAHASKKAPLKMYPLYMYTSPLLLQLSGDTTRNRAAFLQKESRPIARPVESLKI